MRLRKGQRVKFTSVDDNGFSFEAEGTVIGFAEDIRKMSPVEFGEADENAYLVETDNDRKEVIGIFQVQKNNDVEA